MISLGANKMTHKEALKELKSMTETLKQIEFYLEGPSCPDEKHFDDAHNGISKLWRKVFLSERQPYQNPSYKGEKNVQ